jgi:hypothetical protein
MIHREDREANRLAGNDKAVIGDCIEGDVIGGEHGVFVVPLLQVEAKVDFILSAGREAE